MALTDVKVTDLDLPFVKEYLKVDYADEDNFIESIIIGAQSYMQTMLGFKFEDYTTAGEEIPSELTIACLMIIAHWFDQRQIQTTGTLGDEIKFAVTAIIDAHRDYSKGYVDEEDTSHFNL